MSERCGMKALAGLRIAGVVASMALLAGCASTALTPFVSPDYDGRTYHSILVFVDSQDLSLRQEIEGRAAGDIAGYGARAFRASDFFFPGREYSPEEVSGIFQKNGIDAVLVLSQGESGFTSQYVPRTYNTTTNVSGSSYTTANAYGSATRTGNTVYGSVQGTSMTTGSATARSTTTESGGYTVNKPWARFRGELTDVMSWKSVWMGQGDSSGNAYNDFEDLWQSMSDNTVKALNRGGFLPR